MKVVAPFVAVVLFGSTLRTTTTTNTISVVVEAANHPNKQHKHIKNKKKQNQGNIVCVDVADFFYEIILALSTFPHTSDCNEAEDAEIARFLQQKLNAAMKALPGTIKTNNKICPDPIKFRRRGLLSSSFSSSPLPNKSDVPPALDGDILSTVGSSNSTHRDWIPVANHPVLSSLFGEDDRWTRHLYRVNERRHLLRKFIFAGGGRCRFCFYDNVDKRQLSMPVFDVPVGEADDTGIKDNKKENDERISTEQEGRELLYFRHKTKTPNRTKVPDVDFCQLSTDVRIDFENFENGKAEGWKNGKVTTMPSPFGSVMGPLRPGDSVSKVFTQIGEEATEKNSNDKDYLDLVTGAFVIFEYWAIDIPDEYADGFLEDDPMFLYLNGIKVDLSLLSKAPETYFQKDNGETSMDGITFAGIAFFVSEYSAAINHGSGKRIDRKMFVELEFPRVLFDHKNSIDFSIFIKPEAKAKQYAIDHVSIRVQYIPCEITGLENTPFDDFKSITERNLRKQMGLDVAREFQTRAGHCLENKIPVVDIHLVEKTNWKEARPRCT